MNTSHNMIRAHGRNITSEVRSCVINLTTGNYDVQFETGKVYSYRRENLTWMTHPETPNPANLRVSHGGSILTRVAAIQVFRDSEKQYWNIVFENGSERSYDRESLMVAESCLQDAMAGRVLHYLGKVATKSKLQSEDGTNLLERQYQKLHFVAEDMAFSCYVNPSKYHPKEEANKTAIFPFGCNASQVHAVQNALSHQVSVIQGPPGTGKTQTILNIIANLVAAGKTVQVVSNNNSAVMNVLEKLSFPGVELGFLVAMLGSDKNKDLFVQDQPNTWPAAMASWKSDLTSDQDFKQRLDLRLQELTELFFTQERLAVVHQSLNELGTESTYYHQYLTEAGLSPTRPTVRKVLDGNQILSLLRSCQDFVDAGKKPSLLFKLRSRFGYGIGIWSQYKVPASNLLPMFQELFYSSALANLTKEKAALEAALVAGQDSLLVKELSGLSMQYLRAKLADRFNATTRRFFSKDDLWKHPSEVLKQYPVILSTAFSARSSLGTSAEFDYVIIDEASQVDVATGALALSCARRAVVVGDLKQLPNIVSNHDKTELQSLFEEYKLNDGYNSATKSFLQSVGEILPSAPQTLLREHYRCHPKIANFFNQKFYGGSLIVMSRDVGETEVISVMKTSRGNHRRDLMNQRQIDVIRDEVLPKLSDSDDQIGIITPYKNQVTAIQSELKRPQIDVATVHKFQGREKDSIILSTVDDELNDFSDDPNLLNVAVSRAKKTLALVVSGNGLPANSNLQDLIDYIEYNTFAVAKSSIFSVFDLLYRQHATERKKYLFARRRVSEFDSENLMYALIEDVLKELDLTELTIACHHPLNMLIRDYSLLKEDEQRYARNGSTHLDFLIYNRVGKRPVLAIEVDGFHHHKAGTIQAVRDRKKDHVLEIYGIPLLRFATNGSSERQRLQNKLRELMQTDRTVLASAID